MGRVTPEQSTEDSSPGIDSAVQSLAERFTAEEGLNEAAAYARAMVEVLSDPTALAAYESDTLN